MKATDILIHTISYIEENIMEKLTIEDIASHVYVSTVHLQRVFSFVFELPLAEYVRGRKLQKALELLYNTDEKVSDIAYDIGFGHESSFIRSFKREFGVTPSEVRKSPHILPIVPPIALPDFEETEQGAFSDMEFVMIPKMELVGREYQVPYASSETMAPQVALDFWNRDSEQIHGRLSNQIYIGLTRFVDEKADYSNYMPSVMVENGTVVPEGMTKAHIGATLGVRFKYIGHHHYTEINSRVASAMYEKIDQFATEQREHYILPYTYYFEKIDLGECDGDTCLMEWYTPVILTNQSIER